MAKDSFKEYAAQPGCAAWNCLIQRQTALYERRDDIRSEFGRDYTRILHSLAYRRLKHKTQVFFNIENDHICTRMEHVTHVESVSGTIAKYLGLNDELTRAIAIGHDLGHAPFGHQGETVIKELTKKYLNENFWHEKNGLRFADDVELLENNYKISTNLDLTYAVRDGIISHCGEVNEIALFPRKEFIDLNDFSSPGQYQSATWEGCVVKISDKIAYIGRDIEDASSLGFLTGEVKSMLEKMARENDKEAISTTVIMHNMIIDICQNSSPEKGICLSERFLNQLNELKDFNYRYIYGHERLEPFKAYSKMIIEGIFNILWKVYDGVHTVAALKKYEPIYHSLTESFLKWLSRYCEPGILTEKWQEDISFSCENKKIYGRLDSQKIYAQAILDYIAGMTDRFAISMFNELITY